MDEMDIMSLIERLNRARQILNTNSSERTSSPYECDICKDSHYITYRDDEGRLISKACVCLERIQAKQKLERSGLANVIDQLTFDSFKVKNGTQDTMKFVARKYLEEIIQLRGDDKTKKPWMYIGGNPGSGKTHICTAVCGELLRNNIGVVYMEWLTESRRFKFSTDADDFEDQLMDYINPEVLYIDDFLKQKYTENPRFTEADIRIAFTLLDGRYKRNKTTIISTEWNLLDHLLSIDEGLFSRIYERCKQYMVTVDRKPENNYRLMDGEDE